MNRVQKRVNIDSNITLQAWFNIEDDSMSIEDAIERAEATGRKVIEVDGRRLKMLDTKMFVEEEVFVCEKCGAYSRNEQKIIDHEGECHGR